MCATRPIADDAVDAVVLQGAREVFAGDAAETRSRLHDGYGGRNFNRPDDALIEEDTGEKKIWQIVGEPEADAHKGKMSVASPIARTLIGKSKGDTID